MSDKEKNNKSTTPMEKYFELKSQWDAYMQRFYAKYSSINLERFLLPPDPTKVAAYDAKGNHISKLYRFKLVLFAKTEEDVVFFILMFFIILGANIFELSILQKIWFLCVIYLLISVFSRPKQDFPISSLLHYKGKIYHDEETVIREIHKCAGLGYMSKTQVLQCDFQINQAKRIQSEVIGDEILQLPQYESKIIFKITVAAGLHR
jgi:hypothetical protein